MLSPKMKQIMYSECGEQPLNRVDVEPRVLRAPQRSMSYDGGGARTAVSLMSLLQSHVAYNKSMSGIDRSDQMISYYSTPRTYDGT
ncbi:hypothetical protein J6590_052510 [Homalodisca vitripennis]|nr:hypothetical protein J6590_052510 [Homalodisca vitripennis]